MSDETPAERAARIDQDLKAADSKRKADAAEGDKWAKVLDCLQGVTARLDALEKRGDQPKADDDAGETMTSDEERAAVAHVQTKADSVASAFGRSASPPFQSESLRSYRRRMAIEFKSFSPSYRAVDLSELPWGPAFDAAEKVIYADALVAAASPARIPDGELLEKVTMDASGRKIIDFYGSPKSWMSQFSMQPYKARFITPRHRD